MFWGLHGGDCSTAVLWVVTPYRIVTKYQHFGGIFCHRLQSRSDYTVNLYKHNSMSLLWRLILGYWKWPFLTPFQFTVPKRPGLGSVSSPFPWIRVTTFLLTRLYYLTIKTKNSVALVRKRTIPTERPPLVGEVVPTLADRGVAWSAQRIPTVVNLGFLNQNYLTIS
jgi:hypothetical protein